MNGTRESVILRSGIREMITSNEPRTDVRWREWMRKLIFSVHEKHQAHRLTSIQGVVGLVSKTPQLSRGNENSMRSEVASLPKILNGPQSNLVSKTAASNGLETL